MLHTLAQATTGEYRDRGSRFYAFAFSLSEREAAFEQVAALRKQYHDARHHCFAFRLGIKGEMEFVQDDGEPSHSAGAPILGAIRSHEMSNVLVVVVRYFGGTKLGIRGLIEAYRSAASAALERAERLPLIPEILFRLQFDYEQTASIRRLLHPFPTEERAAEYQARCQLTLAIHEAEFPKLAAALTQQGFQIERLE